MMVVEDMEMDQDVHVFLISNDVLINKVLPLFQSELNKLANEVPPTKLKAYQNNSKADFPEVMKSFGTNGLFGENTSFTQNTSLEPDFPYSTPRI